MKEKADHPLPGNGRRRGRGNRVKSVARRPLGGADTLRTLLCHNRMTSLFLSLMKRASWVAFFYTPKASFQTIRLAFRNLLN